MQREIVDRYAWLTAEQFANVVSIAEVTPGPITVNMATFVGYRVAGILGSVVATLALIVGLMLAILLVAMFYTKSRNNPLVDAAFRGLRPTVLALILMAILRLAKTVFGGVWDVALFAAALASSDRSRKELTERVWLTQIRKLAH
jgi:chromate transporter